MIEAAKPRLVRSVDEDIVYINHGSIAFVSKPGILVAKMDLKFRPSTFEYLSGTFAIVVTIYLPGSQQTSTSFFDEFVKLLERLATYSAQVIITGDVNIHLKMAADSDTLYSLSCSRLLVSVNESGER